MYKAKISKRQYIDTHMVKVITITHKVIGLALEHFIVHITRLRQEQEFPNR